MIREKVFFWLVFAAFIGILFFGFISQQKRAKLAENLIEEIEVGTKKSMSKKGGGFKTTWDFGKIDALDTLQGYKVMLERSPFFRVLPEIEVEKVELKPIKEEPKKPLFKYKGRAMMGSKVMVIIEDLGTGKSFFVEEGNMVGDFLVTSIDEKKVILKKKGGEEIMLSAVKEEEDIKTQKGAGK